MVYTIFTAMYGSGQKIGTPLTQRLICKIRKAPTQELSELYAEVGGIIIQKIYAQLNALKIIQTMLMFM